MSIWTHVAATIRFDSIMKAKEFMPDLGKSVFYNSPREDWEKCTVPCGSEGSLHTHLWTNPDTSAMASYTATIFGDLRDYENAGEIINYLERITKGKLVRSGVAAIEVEGQKPVIMHYSNEKWKTASGSEPALQSTDASGE